MRPSFRPPARRRWLSARMVSVATLLGMSLALACSPQPPTPPVDSAVAKRAPGEASLEERLLAPCCWIQTLDMHESELATLLRAEIHERLLRGEPSVAVEDDLAARFGERIRAVPRGHDPRSTVPLLVGIGMILSATGLFLLVRRWLRRPAPLAPGGPLARGGSPASDEYEARLDDELRRLDDS